MVAAKEDKREYIGRDRATEREGEGEKADCDFMTLEVGSEIKFVA